MSAGWRWLDDCTALGHSLLPTNVGHFWTSAKMQQNPGCPIPPDFLECSMGLTNLMRLSLQKAAHAAIVGAAQ